MMIKHRIKCFDSEIMVCERDAASYDLTIQASSNPLGFGRSLETYSSEQTAVNAAEKFCRMYSAAREKGYYLKEKSFTKPDRQTIEVSSYLQADVPVEQFYSQLES